jgi:D-alanyl-D-alanine carboxypeptidase/D-alanyl-D-alanine-endopeptidase (penicillin-binding protein 4)
MEFFPRRGQTLFRTLAILCAFTFAADPARPVEAGVEAFKNAVERILTHPCLKKDRYGIEIYSLDRQETLFAVRENTLFIPASNLKLLTTAVALMTLGPDYRYPTQLYSTGTLSDGVLNGDLYIKGFGDPKFVTEQMWLLVNSLANLPVKKITGNLYADETFFDSERRLGTWGKAGNTAAYNAPLGALSFNFNTVTAFVSPGPGPGSPVRVLLEPKTEFTTVANQAKTVATGQASHLLVNRLDRGGVNEITVSGTLAVGHPREHYFLNITDPARYTVKVLRKYFGHAGIEFAGNTGLKAVPKGARLLLTHESEPIALALRGLNKFSNNFVAEQILKTLGALHFGRPGTTAKGLKVMGEYLGKLGFKPGAFQVLDGSGLSRGNRLSAHQFIRTLRQVRENLGLYPEFISALGVMGVDGNVKKRMNGEENAPRARVKTGTLKGVSALSGYFQAEDGELFAFSILMNDLQCGNGQALQIQDRIVREGLKFKRE